MSKALIEKAFEKVWQTFPNRSEHPNYEHLKELCKYFWETCATWQREQYKNTTEYFTANYCEQLLEENKLLKERFKKYQADNLLEREQLIKELRRWIFMEYVPVFDKLVVDKDKLLAKLDLLEKGGE